jgi:redox-sensitive bicupin YhaK (pirin superfamily)
MRGFQLWINLPASEKMCPPAYQDLPADAMPTVEAKGGVRVKVIAGEYAGVRGPVAAKTTAPLYLDVALPPATHVELPVPAEHNAFVYVYEGGLTVGEASVPPGTLAVLRLGDHVRLEASSAPARAILVAGKPLREPVAKYGPFVMNTPEEIHQAVADFRAGKF